MGEKKKRGSLSPPLCSEAAGLIDSENSCLCPLDLEELEGCGHGPSDSSPAEDCAVPETLVCVIASSTGGARNERENGINEK